MRAVIYARYSSDNQTEASIEGQLRECMEYATYNDIQVIGNYIDRAYSAKTDNRPEFQRMIGLSIENKKQITKKRYTYYLLTSLNIWFLVLLIIKLFADSIFEIDRIFGIAVFNSIKDVQTLIGFVLTVILKRTIKIEANQLYEKPKTQVKAISDDENK